MEQSSRMLRRTCRQCRSWRAGPVLEACTHRPSQDMSEAATIDPAFPQAGGQRRTGVLHSAALADDALRWIRARSWRKRSTATGHDSGSIRHRSKPVALPLPGRFGGVGVLSIRACRVPSDPGEATGAKASQCGKSRHTRPSICTMQAPPGG